MRKTILALPATVGLLFGVGTSSMVQAQLPIAALDVAVTEDFSGYTGAGFDDPPAAGQLDSTIWRVTGASDGDGTFGGTHDAGDFARGSSTGGATSGGVYSFDAGGGVTVFGIQPTAGDFGGGGTFTLRLQNNTGSTIDTIDISYDIWVFNDQGRANSFNFAHSGDDTSYVAVPAQDFTTPEAADATPAWVSTNRTFSITVPEIANGGFYYLQWQTADVSGGGSRDEFGLSGLSITAKQTGATVAAELLAAYSFGGNVVAEFDIDPGAVDENDFTLTVDGSPVTLTGISGTGSTRTLTPASALPVGDDTLDNLAVADTAGTDPGNVDFYVYPPIRLLGNQTVPFGTPAGIIGTITAVVTTGTGDNNIAYAISDDDAPFSGLVIRDTVNTPAEGDEVELLAETFSQFGLLRADANDYINNGPSATTILPLEITPTDFQADDDGTLAAQYAGVLITFNVPLTNATDAGFGEWSFDEGVLIDDVFYDFNTSAEVEAGKSYTIVGIGYFSFGDYKVQPRSAADIVESTTSVGSWELFR